MSYSFVHVFLGSETPPPPPPPNTNMHFLLFGIAFPSHLQTQTEKYISTIYRIYIFVKILSKIMVVDDVIFAFIFSVSTYLETIIFRKLCS